MRYTVAYTRVALNAPAREWLAAQDRAAVTNAGDEIDRILSTDAHIKGSPAKGILRELVVRPLQVYFTVDENDRMAVVWFLRMVPDRAP